MLIYALSATLQFLNKIIQFYLPSRLMICPSSIISVLMWNGEFGAADFLATIWELESSWDNVEEQEDFFAVGISNLTNWLLLLLLMQFDLFTSSCCCCFCCWCCCCCVRFSVFMRIGGEIVLLITFFWEVPDFPEKKN